MANTDAELEYARDYLPMWAGPLLQRDIRARLHVNRQVCSFANYVILRASTAALNVGINSRLTKGIAA
jgi:hypothetical protein